MAFAYRQPQVDTRAVDAREHPSLREDFAGALIGLWAVVGLMLDGRAHETNAVESFFTPWHALLYSGVGAAFAALGLATLRRRADGGRWRRAVPREYRLALAGALTMAAAGVGDMFWHVAFGVERDLAALLSPTHLLLLTGGLLLMTTPLRSAWARGASRPSWAELGPAVLSATLTATTVGFFVEFASPFHDPGPFSGGGSHGGAELGVAGILINTIVIAGAIGVMLRRFGALPPGAPVVLVALPVALLSLAADFAVPGALVAGAIGGLAAELLLRALPRGDSTAALRFGLALVTLPLWLSFFAVLAVTDRLSWEPELWTGSLVLAALSGYGLALLLSAPPDPTAPQLPTRDR